MFNKILPRVGFSLARAPRPAKAVMLSSIDNKFLSAVDIFDRRPLTFTKKYSFSTEQKQQQLESSKHPIVYHLRKQIKQFNLKQPEDTQKLIGLLHELTVQLTSRNFVTEAIETAEKVLQLNEQFYVKLKDKTLLQKTQRVIYFRILKELYRSTKQLNKSVTIGKKLAEAYTEMAAQNSIIEPLLLNQLFELGKNYFQLNEIDECDKMLEKVIEIGLRNSVLDQVSQKRQKVIEANNLLISLQFEKKRNMIKTTQIVKKNLDLIQKAKKNKNFSKQILSDFIMKVASIYCKQILSFNQKQINEILSKIDPQIKQVTEYYLKSKLPLAKLQQLSRNLGLLHLKVKNFNKAIIFFRSQREYIQNSDFMNLAICYQNQSIVYSELRKIEKAIQKVQKATKIRVLINLQLIKKKRRSNQQQNLKTNNWQKLLSNCKSLIQLYQNVKNHKKSQKWKQQYIAMTNSTIS